MNSNNTCSQFVEHLKLSTPFRSGQADIIRSLLSATPVGRTRRPGVRKEESASVSLEFDAGLGADGFGRQVDEDSDHDNGDETNEHSTQEVLNAVADACSDRQCHDRSESTPQIAEHVVDAPHSCPCRPRD